MNGKRIQQPEAWVVRERRRDPGDAPAFPRPRGKTKTPPHLQAGRRFGQPTVVGTEPYFFVGTVAIVCRIRLAIL
jgi:hypothetical protein